MSIKVTNINGTSDNDCSCGSWLKHWLKYSKTKTGQCREVSCTNTATHGAHVLLDGDNNWYIIPLCATHNGMKGKTIEVIQDTTFVSANVSKTCGK